MGADEQQHEPQAEPSGPRAPDRPQPAPMAERDPQTATIEEAPESTTAELWRAAGSRVERIVALDSDPCPNCTSGVLRVTVYDELSTHEFGQDIDRSVFKPSGGAVQRHCFHCEYHESLPLNAFRKAEG